MKSGTVAITGRPNAGKSTLLNALLGTPLSLVSKKAQTTRDLIRGIHSVPDKGQILFEDTPGIHNADKGGINEAMLQNVKLALKAPDAIWVLIHPESAPHHEQVVLETLKQWSPKPWPPVAVVITHGDQAEAMVQAEATWIPGWIDTLTEVIGTAPTIFRVSGKTKGGLESLEEWTWAQLKEGPIFYADFEQIADRPVRYFAGELIRGSVFENLQDELPYSCAIEVTSFKEEPKKVSIHATLWMERDSQKGMVVGKGGQMIKKIGMLARRDIAQLVDCQVDLRLRVDVAPNWTKDPKRLQEMGYVLP